MAKKHEDSSVPTINETAENDRAWIEMKLMQSIVVQSSFGQILLRLIDNCLWTVEKCAEWSLPNQEVLGDENGKASEKPELVRPLPWLFFLPSLVILRMIRMTLNIGASIIGYSEITPSRMVRSVQMGRRRLNMLRNNGKREKSDSEDKRLSMNEARKALIRSIRLTLSNLSCLDTSKPSLSPPPTRIYVSNVLDPDVSTTITEEKSVTESMDSTIKETDSIIMSESEENEEEKEHDETLTEKINRLASEDSEEDEDFDPGDCSRNSSNTSSSEESTVSPTELSELIEDANVLLGKITSTNKETQQFLDTERDAAKTSEKRSPAKESCNKVEEHLSNTQRIDSPECYTPDRSSQEGDPTFYSPISSDNDTPREHSVSSSPIVEKRVSRDILETNKFLNGEVHFTSESSVSEMKSFQKINNGAIVEKRSTNMNKGYRGKRISHGNRKKK